MDEIVKREAPPDDRKCVMCGSPMLWRCNDCFDSPVLCTPCCRSGHVRSPFHRVSRWNGDAFISSTLRDTDLVLYLGHAGNMCTQHEEPCGPEQSDRPSHSSTRHDYSSRPSSPESEIEDDPELPPSSSDRFLRGKNAAGMQWMTIVDITGIHQLPVCFCSCDPAVAGYLQLLRSGLYPVSRDRPRTVFTFRVLDDYHEDNLESKKSAQKYYNKLKRLTDNAFVSDVPDRYRELMRVAREWRNIKLRQRGGVSHDVTVDIQPGALVPFCAACPQPGVNLPDDWKEDPDQYVLAIHNLFTLCLLLGKVEIYADLDCRWKFQARTPQNEVS